MRLEACCHPCPPPRAVEPCAATAHRPAHHLAEAEAARIVPGTLAEQGAPPATDEPCRPDATGKWPWQLPPSEESPPPPESKVWVVPFPSPAEARTGSMLDMLA